MSDITLSRLHEIFESIMKKQQDKIDPLRSKFGKIEKEEVSLEDKMEELKKYAAGHRHFSFRGLLTAQSSKVEVIVTFLAILELMKMGRIHLTQEHTFDDMWIETLEQEGDKWLVRSMNPATTGLHRPPYAQETPPGVYIIQEKKPRMIYLVDGTTETGGFAPYASRFTNGGYIHGVPVNAPRKSLIEYSSTLGTTPRSHMCVRNATSHAKFIYDWAPVYETLVFVFD